MHGCKILLWESIMHSSELPNSLDLDLYQSDMHPEHDHTSSDSDFFPCTTAAVVCRPISFAQEITERVFFVEQRYTRQKDLFSLLVISEGFCMAFTSLFYLVLFCLLTLFYYDTVLSRHIISLPCIYFFEFLFVVLGYNQHYFEYFRISRCRGMARCIFIGLAVVGGGYLTMVLPIDVFIEAKDLARRCYVRRLGELQATGNVEAMAERITSITEHALSTLLVVSSITVSFVLPNVIPFNIASAGSRRELCGLLLLVPVFLGMLYFTATALYGRRFSVEGDNEGVRRFMEGVAEAAKRRFFCFILLFAVVNVVGSCRLSNSFMAVTSDDQVDKKRAKLMLRLCVCFVLMLFAVLVLVGGHLYSSVHIASAFCRTSLTS